MNQDITRRNAEEISNILSNIEHNKIEEIAKLIKTRIYNPATKVKSGKKLLVCGNGGSAAQAEHLMAELIGRYKDDRIPFPCLSLAGCAATQTCIANDYGQEFIFSRTLEALGEGGDILIALTTSGYSDNVLKTVKKAKEIGITTIALLGQKREPKKPGQEALHGIADYEIIIPSTSTARTQEAHLFIIHAICDYLEKWALENNN